MTQPNVSIELTTATNIHQQQGHFETSAADTLSGEVSHLQPTDRGQAAWRLLLAAFIFEALLWGFPLSFGVFQTYYSSIPEFRDSRYVSVVGTTASGIAYLGAPLATPLVRKWSRYRRQMILVGWPLCIGSLVAGSFCTKLATLILTQGVMYGVGFLVFYYPILAMVDEFWVSRRGMAYGLLCSASGMSGAVMPMIVQALLTRFGYRTTLRIIAVSLVVLTGPLIPLLKGRIEQRHSIGLKLDWSFLRLPLFWTYSTSNILMGLGYFFPSLYLPSYASSLGLSASKGALLLAFMSISQVAGQFTFGYLSDKKLSLNVLITISSSTTAIVTLSAWGLGRSLAPLTFFALLYGFFGAGYTAMWARMVTAVSEQPNAAQAIFGLFNFQKGIGNMLAGPIGAGLVHGAHVSGYGHGRYRALIIFSGSCWLLSTSTLGLVYCNFKQR